MGASVSRHEDIINQNRLQIIQNMDKPQVVHQAVYNILEQTRKNAGDIGYYWDKPTPHYKPGGNIETIVEAMQHHPQYAVIQYNCCVCLNNFFHTSYNERAKKAFVNRAVAAGAYEAIHACLGNQELTRKLKPQHRNQLQQMAYRVLCTHPALAQGRRSGGGDWKKYWELYENHSSFGSEVLALGLALL